MSVIFVNHTTYGNDRLDYPHGKLSCLRPQIVDGSRLPTTLIKLGDRNTEESSMGLLLMIWIDVAMIIEPFLGDGVSP